jgi:hypothetical protein
MKIQLVEDWRKAYKWFSMHIMAWGAVVLTAYLEAPAELKAAIPPDLLNKISIAMLVLGVIVRLLKQGGKEENAKD